MGPGPMMGGAPPQGMPMSQPRPSMMAAGQPHSAVGPPGGMPPAGGQFSNHLGPASVSLSGDLNRPSSSKEQLRGGNQLVSSLARALFLGWPLAKDQVW